MQNTMVGGGYPVHSTFTGLSSGFIFVMFSASMVLLLSLYEQDVLVIGFVGNGIRCCRTV